MRRADLPAVVTLCAEHAAFERAHFRENGQAERLGALLFGEEVALHLLVVEQGERVRGYASYAPQLSTWAAARYLYLDCLFLQPELRGRGVGRWVMEAVGEEATRMGCAWVEWQTPRFNDAAIGFYRRLGAVGLDKVRFAWDRP